MPGLFTGVYDIVAGYAIPALAILTLVVFVHEMGHFLVARWCGIRVDAFSIGFGKEIVGLTDRRGTRWKLSAIPLGGYVKFTGDRNAASMPPAERPDTVPGVDPKTLFHTSDLWRRTLIVAAGPFANFVMAALVFAVLFDVYGRPISLPRVDAIVADSAAERAGMKPGDLIVSIDGYRIESFAEVQRTVMLSAGDPLEIVVERAGVEVTLTAIPQRREVSDGLGGTQRVGVLGVSRSVRPEDVVYQKFGPVSALVEGVRECGMIVERTMTYVFRLFSGRETTDQLSGPVRVAQISGVVASSGGIPALMHLMAVLSVSIGLINLFPVPMLDGGHLVFYGVEAIRGRPLSARAQDLSFRIGFALVILLFVFVTFNDIVKLAGI